MKAKKRFSVNRAFTIKNASGFGWPRHGYSVVNRGDNIRDVCIGRIPLATIGTDGRIYRGSAFVNPANAVEICPPSVWAFLAYLGIIHGEVWKREFPRTLTLGLTIFQGRHGGEWKAEELLPPVPLSQFSAAELERLSQAARHGVAER